MVCKISIKLFHFTNYHLFLINQKVMKQSLLAVSSDLFYNNGNLVLNCDSVIRGNDSGLVFSPTPQSSGKLNLFSANHTIWNSNSNKISRVWDSISYDHVPSSKTRGSV